MKINVFCFSPTGGTKKAAQHLAGALGGEAVCTDLTVHPAQATPADMAVIAVPSFGGRVSPLAAQRIRQLQGGGTPAVLLCVYGNRAYEDTLAELRDLAAEAGFRVAAAVAAIAEHSIARQFAAGRPDAQDLDQLSAFGEAIRQKLDRGELTEPELPGNRPYKPFGVLPMLPAPTGDCISCGVCAKECPAQAIDPQDVSKVDKDACISCMRCIAVCSHAARQLSPEMLDVLSNKLAKVCADRKENELYL
ncbi:4Fe-4S binding protein [Gemmiger sp. An194]|uniref:4Fe-4S binding protein n=1 Tax=Gemmiger sp. An194 TaxID=1965582 RepID=UPI000B390CE6|nr:4Fe-4S binding protein [Gemmiger sp. An194]OUP25672.1 4Fe-4S ferredoxin [Gemmiger sp. An194]